jgi:Ca-activated chloride channel homolog
MVFLNAGMLLLLLLIPVFVGFELWRLQVRQRRLQSLGDPASIDVLLTSVDARRRQFKTALWFTVVFLLVIALARPTWGIAEELIEAEGVAVIVALDVSTSMDAEDVQPSRLERAKFDAREIFANNAGNQLGLILFAGQAFVQFPLTTDQDAAMTFLDAASTGSISQQGTSVEAALELALDVFDERIASEGIIVLLSDGENHEGRPLLVADEAAERGLTVHTIGYGDPNAGSPIPLDDTDIDARYKVDGGGSLVFTRLEEDVLQDVAVTTGGIYQQASTSGIEVINVLNAIDTVETTVLERRRQTRRVERFSLFAGLALMALTIQIILPERASS